MAFKDRLKEYRESLGMTQSELAAAAGVTMRTLQNYDGRNCGQHPCQGWRK